MESKRESGKQRANLARASQLILLWRRRNHIASACCAFRACCSPRFLGALTELPPKAPCIAATYSLGTPVRARYT